MDFSKEPDRRAIAEAGSVYHLTDDYDDPMYTAAGKPVTFTVLGKESRVFKRKVAAIVAKSQAKQKGSRQNKAMSEEQILRALDENEETAAETIAAVVVDTSGVEWKGKPVGGDYDTLLELFKKHPHIVKKIDAFIDDNAAFLANAKES